MASPAKGRWTATIPHPLRGMLPLLKGAYTLHASPVMRLACETLGWGTALAVEGLTIVYPPVANGDTPLIRGGLTEIVHIAYETPQWGNTK